MNKKTLKLVEKEILKCKQQLKELEPLMYKGAGFAENYNRVLVKKAILVDKYKKIAFKKPIISRLANIFKFRRPAKLICDYFPNS